MKIIEERLQDVLANKSLAYGSHGADGVMCVMEAAAHIAGEPWSDRPKCVCPSIADFMVSWNDGLPSDAERDRLLKPLLRLVIGTRSTREVEMRRRWMAFDWLARVNAPAWMDLTESLKPHATALRGLPEINTIDLAMPVLQEARKASAAAGAAAGAAAWAAAWAAAGVAAGDAAGAAAGDAAGAAAGAAGWAAAGAAALQPTVATLQSSAQDLVRRMCAVTP